jgi:hypothetical protein
MLSEKEIKDRIKNGAFQYVPSDYMIDVITLCLN